MCRARWRLMAPAVLLPLLALLLLLRLLSPLPLLPKIRLLVLRGRWPCASLLLLLLPPIFLGIKLLLLWPLLRAMVLLLAGLKRILPVLRMLHLHGLVHVLVLLLLLSATIPFFHALRPMRPPIVASVRRLPPVASLLRMALSEGLLLATRPGRRVEVAHPIVYAPF